MDVRGPVITMADASWPHLARRNWVRQDHGAGRVTWQHRPTQMIYQVTPDAESGWAVARLLHVCDAAAMPSQDVQEWYGHAAILMEMRLGGTLNDGWLRFVPKGKDGPPEPLTPEEEVEIEAWYEEVVRDQAEQEQADQLAGKR